MELQDLINHPISWSRLKYYDKSPAHFFENWLRPPEQTPAMLLGSALHCLVLEPERFSERYAVAPPDCDRRTKAGKEQWGQFLQDSAGKSILTVEQYEQAFDMSVAATRTGSKAAQILEICNHREETITWTDPLTDLPCKGVIDAWGQYGYSLGECGFCVDIKTTDDASPSAFRRTCANYMYHGQAAFYLDGLRQNGQYDKAFFFIVVEKNRPYGVQVYMCDEEMINAGRVLYQRLLEKHAECLAAGEWPGYPDEVVSLSLPAWAA